MSAHPLTTFVSETFGRQFGDLLLAGYGTEPGSRRRRLYITESEARVEIRWVIELVAHRPPSGDEPLVLAALLKLLLSQPSISHHLEFELTELLAELQWQDDMSTLQQVETAIAGYVRLLYDKQTDTRAVPRTSAITEGGYYHLLTGYVRGHNSKTKETLARPHGGVYFDAGFIRSLRRGRVCFAGIDFGALYQAHDSD